MVFFLPLISTASTSIVTWSPPAGGLKNTYSDTKTFSALKGNILSIRMTGTISSGSSVSVYIKINSVDKEIIYYDQPNFSFTETATIELPEDGDYTISYNYEHDGGGTAYRIDIYADLISQLDEDYIYSLKNGDEFHKDGFHYKYDGSLLRICSCKTFNYTGDIIIPSFVNYRGYNYIVGSTESYAFRGCKEIQSIKFNNPSFIIGEYTFVGCSNLLTVELPHYMEKLESGVFTDCTSLVEIDIQNIKEINYSAFENCSSLKQIQFSDELTSIGAYAFTGCALTSITFPNSLESIGSKAFSKCTALNKVIFGNSVRDLGEYAFQYCTGLESVSIGKSLENVGNAFYGCSLIKKLTYLEGCEKTISTFFTNVIELSLPNSLIEISDESFKRFENLKTIKIPNSVTRIGHNSFYYCESIRGQLVIPDNVKEIGEEAFSGCKNITSVVIGNSCEVIGNRAFSSCSAIKEINFPSSLGTIGQGTFGNCRNIVEIIFESGITEIGDGAFANCSGILRLSTPSSLLKIGNRAFKDCSNLSDLSFANGLKSIGEHAFCGCNKLTSLKLPDSVTSIGESAFAADYGTGNQAYSVVQIGNGLKEMLNVFYGLNHNLPQIEELVIGNGITSIHDDVSIFGYSFGSDIGKWRKPISYLLTDNKVDLSCNRNFYDPHCTIYVADVSKYTEEEIKKYGIRNIISTTSYSGEYSGTVPDINFISNLSDYNATILQEYFDVGSYSSMKVNFSKDDFSSTITVPCNYTITKAPLTITPYDMVISYGEEIPDFTCFYQGLKNDETPNIALSKLPTVTTTAQKGNDTGEYKLYVSGAVSKNYALSYNIGTLTIKPAQQTIVWNQSFGDVVSDSKIELLALSSCGLKIQYNSSNPSIAYVVEEGGKTYLYTRKDGTIILTATQPGNKNYEAALNVEKTIIITPRMATGIELSSSNIDMKVGEEYTLIATVLPETTIDKSIEWSSSDNTVASVSNGLVRAFKLGEATIQAKTKDGSNLTASCRIKVIPIMVESIALSNAFIQLVLGNSERITATVLPNNATNKEIIWEVENNNIVSVNDGLITALGIGSTKVKAKANDDSGVYATCSVIVNPITIGSIELSAKYTAINVGESITLLATITPSNASNQQLTWQSSDNDVASVSNGIVTAKKPGNVIITVQSTDGSNISATVSIKVNDIKTSNIYLDKSSMKLFVGDKETLIATITPKNATNKDVVWTTSDANVATVADGVIIAKGMGTALISAYTTDGTNLSATCQVSIEKRNQIITWQQSFQNIQYGGQLVELTAITSSGLRIKYKSNDESIVSIFDLGDIVYLNPGNCGHTSVVAYHEGNNEYFPTEIIKDVEVINTNSGISKTLIAYYSQSTIIDGIVAELANQIASLNISVNTQKIEPTNNRINDANTNSSVRDSVMNVICQYPYNVNSYPNINYSSMNVNEYDNVIMVYPLWNSMMAAPMQTFNFINKGVLKNKSVAYIEYDLFEDVGTSSNAKVLRLNASNVEDMKDLIGEWLSSSNVTGLLQLQKERNPALEEIYDFQGRKMSTFGKHGLYIIKGKKIIK